MRGSRGPAILHVRLGQALTFWGWPGLAIRAYADALAVEPDCAEAHQGLGDALGRRGLWLEGSRALAEAARLRPASAEIQGNLVLALGRAGRWRAALPALERLIRMRPGESELHVLRGAVLMKLRRPHEAIGAFRWAVQLPAPPAFHRLVLGEALLGAARWNQVLLAHRAAVAARSAGGTAAWGPARGSVLNRPPSMAVSLGAPPPPRSLLREPVELPAALVAGARASLSALARGCRSALGWTTLLLGRDLAHRREAESVAWSLRQARRLGLNARALAGSLAAALLLPTPGFAAGRVDSLAALQEARLCVEETRKRAIEPCRMALALGLSPARSYWVHRVLARKLESLDRWDEAVEVYREQVGLDPKDADGHLRLGSVLLYGQHRPEQAAAELRESIRLKPGLARAWGELGVVQNVLGGFAESVSAFEEALRLDPAYLEGRPTARLVLEASRKGERWP